MSDSRASSSWKERRAVIGTSTEVDVVLLLVVLGVAALLGLVALVARQLAPARPLLPADDRPPPGLGRLVPVGRQVDQECRRGFAALELWMSGHRPRP
jgi:hypothetical protein